MVKLPIPEQKTRPPRGKMDLKVSWGKAEKYR